MKPEKYNSEHGEIKQGLSELQLKIQKINNTGKNHLELIRIEQHQEKHLVLALRLVFHLIHQFSGPRYQ